MNPNKCNMCTFNNPLYMQNCQVCHSQLSNRFDSEIVAEVLRADERERSLTENYLKANELIPESFVPVQMIFIPCIINGHFIKVMIDTGAQSSVMSKKCAIECGLENMIDHRFSGTARGVGTSRIIGQIWFVELEIGEYSIPCSFSVLEADNIDVIFGLNTMVNHRCTLDFEKREIRINGLAIPFVE